MVPHHRYRYRVAIAVAIGFYGVPCQQNRLRLRLRPRYRPRSSQVLAYIFGTAFGAWTQKLRKSSTIAVELDTLDTRTVTGKAQAAPRLVHCGRRQIIVQENVATAQSPFRHGAFWRRRQVPSGSRESGTVINNVHTRHRRTVDRFAGAEIWSNSKLHALSA